MKEEAIKAILVCDDVCSEFLKENGLTESPKLGPFSGKTAPAAVTFVIWCWSKRLTLKQAESVLQALDMTVAPKTFNTVLHKVMEDIDWLWLSTFMDMSDVEMFEGQVLSLNCVILMDSKTGLWRGFSGSQSVPSQVTERITGTVKKTNKFSASTEMNTVISTIQSVYKLYKTRYSSLRSLLNELSFRRLASVSGVDTMRVYFRVFVDRYISREDSDEFKLNQSEEKMIADPKLSLAVAEVWDRKEKDAMVDDEEM